jgi:23S rRNA pseudouridine2605 synthase
MTKPSTRPATSNSSGDDEQPRLQKILASAGIGSRRACEALIQEGRVEVDGRIVTELGTRADPEHQQIRVDGVPLERPRRVHFLVHKPPGVLSTNNDPSGRPRVIDLVPYQGRLFTVGRLDASSEGLILVTNDGELANRLAHPRYGVEKTYQVEVAGTIDRAELARLRAGVHLAEGFAKVVSARVRQQYKNSTQLEIVLAEGRNREIRRLLARVGHKVLRLKRVALGPLRLADLPSGAVRPLTARELRDLRSAAREVAAKPKPRRKRRAAPVKAAAAQPRRAIIGGDAQPRAGTPSKARRPNKHRRSVANKKRRSPRAVASKES